VYEYLTDLILLLWMFPFYTEIFHLCSLLLYSKKYNLADNVVGIVTRLRARRSRIRAPAGAKFFSPNVQTSFRAHLAFYSVSTEALS
jgi:hypothetical protein